MTANQDNQTWEAGIHQAITWLQANYAPNCGPRWRTQGVEWITERLAEHQRTTQPHTQGTEPYEEPNQ